MLAYEQYYAKVTEQIRAVYQGQRKALDEGAHWIANALIADHWIYAFGTGHSHMLAEEIFYRAGGLARAVPILDDNLMLHRKAIEATWAERRENYAEGLLNLYPVAPGDVLLVISNSGRNAVPIEMALTGRKRGLKVIAITNLKQTNAWVSRHSSGKTLAEVSDLTIDNCSEAGDACVRIEGLAPAVGPTSTITGAYIINGLIVGALERVVNQKQTPEIYVSSNTDGDEHNQRLLSKYQERIRHL